MGSKVRTIVIQSPKLVVPALAALGIGAPAGALELGPVRMDSTLGQPLRASIAFVLRPHELIAAHCIRVATGTSAGGLPSPGPTWVSVHDGAIHLVSEHPVADPLVGLELTVDCPYAAHLSRQYVVLIDPPRAAAPEAPEQRVASAAEEDTAAPARRASPESLPVAPAASPARASRASQPAIAASTSYRVRPGDTLSGIAERLSGRRLGLWPTVDRLLAANPQAFVAGDPNRLRAGELLRIPDDVYADAPAAARSDLNAPALADAVPASAPASTGYNGYAAADAAELPTVAPVERAEVLFRDALPVPVAAAEAEEPTAASTPAVEAEAGPRPGDVLVDAQGLFVTPVDGGMAAPQPAARGSAAPAAAPATRMAPLVRAEGGAEGGAWSWLIGLGGSGVALILGLLLFGRVRRQPGRDPVFDVPERDAGQDARDVDGGQDAAQMPVDFRFDDADAHARIVRVDADLDDGRGFQESGDLVVAQDFGFADSGSLELGLDLDFSQEAPAAAPARRAREGEVIVEREVPPGDQATSEYDLSMVVDATRQPIGDGEDTEKDLQAIQLDAADSEPEEDPFTLSHEVDYRILEQDYEDELTATQALALELSSAARDLVEQLYEPGETGLHELPTVEMPAAGTEPTVDMPAAGSEATAEMPTPGSEETAEMPTPGSEATTEMPATGTGATAEMPGSAAGVETEAGGDTTEMLPSAALADGDDTGVDEALAVVPDAGNDADLDLAIESATIDTKKLKVS
ncbi:MAG TPA: LysM peptidoglycan-binding domain-containing protein [Gammaproteobacteria bacterium]